MATATKETLHDQLLARVDSSTDLAGDAAELVLAACEGPAALASALAPESGAAPAAAPAAAVEELAPAYLRSVTVEGFRGIGKASKLEIAPGAGLTLVVGRNGSGKSSFAEALELLLTGRNARWAERTSVWKQGWRSLHHSTARIEAVLSRDGVKDETTVTATWEAAETSVDEFTITVKPASDGTLAELGWEQALERFRPFLSYSELGRMFERPSALYESLNTVLGLGRVDDMLALLSRARIDADNASKALRSRAKEFCIELARLDDPRAAACGGALTTKPPDVEALELLLDAPDDDGDLPHLRALAALSLPDADTAEQALGVLGAAIARYAALEASDAGRAAQIATLLEHALASHGGADHECLVCHAALPGDWRVRTTEEVTRLRAASEEHADTRRAVSDQLPHVLALASADPPSVVLRAAEVALDPTRAIAAWERWAHACKSPLALPHDGAPVLAELREAVDELAAAAAARVSAVEAAWRPMAGALGDWLPTAQSQQTQAARLGALKQAEAWLLGAADELREERLAPIQDAAIANWNQLRHESNVTLGAIKLSGKGKQRHAEFAVNVDETGAAALGVMSQGELHALALSVFLPRATREDSPFRFVMIDDPVQSMDPAKVDGLARVLASAADTRQVIVFTHDERLAEATRRLGLSARITQVHRRPGSLVETRLAYAPAQQAIADARALLYEEQVSPMVKNRVVPAFCREAIEASCAEAVRRKRLGRGDTHASVDEALLRANTLYQRVALALFDDEGRAGDVAARIGGSFGKPAADALRRCNAGAHGEDDGEGLKDFVSVCARLSTELAS